MVEVAKMASMNLFASAKKVTKAVAVNRKSIFANLILANMEAYVKNILIPILASVKQDFRAKIAKLTWMIVS
jgi:hypothetical protein